MAAKATTKKTSVETTADRTPEEKKKALETAISRIEKNALQKLRECFE